MNSDPQNPSVLCSNASACDSAPFDVVLESPLKIPPREKWRFGSLLEMLEPKSPDEDASLLLIGAGNGSPTDLTLADLRRVASRAESWLTKNGLGEGDSMMLLRLPYSCDAPLAAAAFALMSLGVRVVLPMSFDRATLADMAETADCKALLWCAGNQVPSLPTRAQRADATYQEIARNKGIATYSLTDELNWHSPPEDAEPDLTADKQTPRALDREVLVLSTSGSTGRPKLVRYTEEALLQVAESWNAAGLMDEELTGGRSICPTVSHSMGLRNVIHAIWNRQPTLLPQPEWLQEQPKKFVGLLERSKPMHITCGPAFLRDLSLLSTHVKRIRDSLNELRVVVSSGAADQAIGTIFPKDVRVANAFGMTELQQVLNTLLAPTCAVAGALGRPLPGVSAAVRFVDANEQLGRLYISSSFAARGYVGEQDFGPWFDTGDLVRVIKGELVWVGRANQDYLNSGHGVKMSLAELSNAYESTRLAAEAILFVPLSSASGVGVLVYIGDRDPLSDGTKSWLLRAVAQDHERMATAQQDFALDHMAATRIGLVAGRPPIHGPGKIDRGRALAEQAELLEAMNTPTRHHPAVIQVPKHESQGPDWRRFL